MTGIKIRDRIRGCMIGGAAGDALGYAVEFMGEKSIFLHYGESGITEYELKNGTALISDDTQMALFTAGGLIDWKEAGSDAPPAKYVQKAYLNWYATQTKPFVNGYDGRYMDDARLFSRRAPGGTCLRALAGGSRDICDFISDIINDSKGCGGVMRTAPMALISTEKNYPGGLDAMDMDAAQLAAITHTHSLGYMPSAALNRIIVRILQGADIKTAALEAVEACRRLFDGDGCLEQLTELIEQAVSLAEGAGSDLDNIHALGEGWVAEETLAIAVCCAVRYQDDFSKGLIASVNHCGDSDSTGAVAGNILGAYCGYDAIPDKWKQNLELNDLLLGAADMLSGIRGE